MPRTPDPTSLTSSDNGMGKQPPRPAVWAGDFVASTSPNAVDVSVDTVVCPGLLCVKCQPIRTWLETNYKLRGDHVRREDFKHHATGLELETHYLEGCHLCTLIWHAFVDAYWCQFRSRWQKRSSRLELVRKGKNGKLSLRIAEEANSEIGGVLSAQLDIEGKEIQSDDLHLGPWHLYHRAVGRDGHRTWRRCSVQLSASANDISTATDSVLQTSARWLENCVTTHENCRKMQRRVSSTGLPKRLLDLEAVDVNNTIKVVLVDGSFSTTRYAALSYCWGNSQGYKLTSSTTSALQSGVGIQHFSKTIQDTIHVTRWLGLRWLWIDALCIIQDSIEDWTQEAASMVDVYQNCFICIAATGASSAEEGLFTQRDPLLHQSCELSRGPQGKKTFAFLDDSGYYGLHQRHAFNTCFEKSALHKRGWVMQERLLPPRTLNFGSVIVWECREQYGDEFSLSRDIGRQTLKGDFSSLILQHTAPRKISEEEGGKIRNLWGKILARYTGAKLTVQNDKLMALSGVIRAIERSTGWRNIWGLWEPFLLRELMWRSAAGGVASPALACPSWSWASLNVGVSFGPTKEGLGRGSEDVDGDLDLLLASLEDVITPDEPGANPRSILRISCLPVKLKDPVETVFNEWGDVCKELVDFPVFVTFRLDISSGEQRAHVFLPLMEHLDPKSAVTQSVSGLVLANSSTRPGAFERVGFAKCPGTSARTLNMSPPDFSGSITRQILELV